MIRALLGMANFGNVEKRDVAGIVSEAVYTYIFCDL